MKERQTLIDSCGKLSIRKQCSILSINRSSFYYKPKGESNENLLLMELMDKHYLKYPTCGVLSMTDYLTDLGFKVNIKRVRRLLRKMGLEAIYRKKNLSKLGQAQWVHPYLLKGLQIVRRNQVWEIDITYIPMKKGFLYLTAIIDVYSRFIVGWGISNTLSSDPVHNVLKEAIGSYGSPEIINSDQGSQFTCKEWIKLLNTHDIQISMDGKGRAVDNIYIERFWRTIKYDYVYLNPAEDGLALYQGIKEYILYYNRKRHQGIGREKPCNLYRAA